MVLFMSFTFLQPHSNFLISNNKRFKFHNQTLTSLTFLLSFVVVLLWMMDIELFNENEMNRAIFEHFMVKKAYEQNQKRGVIVTF